MQQFVKAMTEQRRAERMRGSPQLTLGQLIRQLEAIPATYESQGKTEPKRVWFDFGRTYPDQVMSWRGSYAELAISFDFEGKVRHRCSEPWSSPQYMTAERFLGMLRNSVGATFTGYKGGDFTMDEDTPVWVANYGDSGNTGVVGVRDNRGYEIIIDTTWCEF